MKKNSFIQGAFIATLGIILSKFLGIIYVIPFYSIVGAQGGALYGYAYSIYTVFLGISQAGIPVAISKIISEYDTLGLNYEKNRSFELGKKIMIFLGIVSFLLMFIFSRSLANIIIGDITGGNNINDVTFVIRIISFALLIVPVLSIYRGYLQGHKFITATSVSQVLEQIVRIVIIIIGSYVSLKVLNLGLTNTIGISVFAATIASLISYIYLFIKVKKNKNSFNKESKKNTSTRFLDNEIIKKIIIYAIPFVMIDIFRSLINSVDVFMLVKVLVNDLGYSITKAEEVMSVVSTWGQKLNMIVVAVCSGLIISLVPNLTTSLVKKDHKDIETKVNQTVSIALFLTIPMTIGISFLAQPIWTLFYGYNELCTSVYTYYVFVALGNVLFTVGIVTLQVLKEHKRVFVYLMVGLLLNVFLNIPLLHLFSKLGLPAYYGSTTATIIGYSVSGILALYYIKKKFKIRYKDTLIKLLKIIIFSTIMLLTMLILKQVISFSSTDRIINMIYIISYSLIGFSIYILLSFKTKLIYQTFGNDIFKKLLSKIKKTT